MSELEQNTIPIRGESYVVRELTGKEMKAVRKLLRDPDEKLRYEAYVTFIACVSPKFKSEEAAADASQHVLNKVSAESMRLTLGDLPVDKDASEGDEPKS